MQNNKLATFGASLSKIFSQRGNCESLKFLGQGNENIFSRNLQEGKIEKILQIILQWFLCGKIKENFMEISDEKFLRIISWGFLCGKIKEILMENSDEKQAVNCYDKIV